MAIDNIDELDNLNTGRVKLNQAIDQANTVQGQLDTIIIDSGTSDAETIQARGGEPLLYNRLDKVDTQLAEIVVNVKNFNALGDGVVNERQSVLNALSFLESHGGGTLYFPSGVYDIRGNISLPNINIKIKGNNAKIICSERIEFSPLFSGIDFTKSLEVEDIDIDCMNNTHVCFLINNTSDGDKIVFKNSKITNVYKWSSLQSGSSSFLAIFGGFEKVDIQGCEFVSCGRQEGVYVAGSNGSQGVIVSRSNNNKYTKHFNVQKTKIIKIYTDDILETDCDSLVYFTPLEIEVKNAMLNIENSVFENSHGRFIKLQTVGANVVIDDNLFNINNEQPTIVHFVAIDDQQGANIKVDNNTFLIKAITEIGLNYWNNPDRTRPPHFLKSSAKSNNKITIENNSFVSDKMLELVSSFQGFFVGGLENGLNFNFSDNSFVNIPYATLIRFGDVLDKYCNVLIENNSFENVSNILMFFQDMLSDIGDIKYRDDNYKITVNNNHFKTTAILSYLPMSPRLQIKVNYKNGRSIEKQSNDKSIGNSLLDQNSLTRGKLIAKTSVVSGGTHFAYIPKKSTVLITTSNGVLGVVNLDVGVTSSLQIEIGTTSNTSSTDVMYCWYDDATQLLYFRNKFVNSVDVYLLVLSSLV